MRTWNRETIKYIAMLTMLLNHIAHIFLEPGTFLWVILIDVGFFTGPVMCWFLVEGYHYTRSKKRYAQRLFLFAVLSQFPFCLAFSYGRELYFPCWNMLFTLWICFLILTVLEKVENPCLKLLLCILLTGTTGWCDWPFVAAIGTMLFAYTQKGFRSAFRQSIPHDRSFKLPALSSKGCLGEAKRDTVPSKKEILVSFLVMAVLAAAYQYEIYSDFLYQMPKLFVHVPGAFCGVMSAGIAVACFYNGKCMERGHTFSKWFFYSFYPVHLLLLGVLRIMCI